MLDQKWIREHTDDVATLLQNRNDYNFPLAKYIELDSQRKKILSEVEVLKEKRNIGAKKIANLKKEGEHPQPLIDEMRELGEEVKGLDERASDVQRALDDLALRIPNKIHDSVPIGKDETFNLEIRKFGTPKQFNFQPKPHWEICEPLGLMDFERGVKIAESRFTVMFAEGARLVRGLINFMLDLHTKKHAFTEVMPPILVNTKTMTGTGQLPKFSEDLYRCVNDDLWLIPTAEVPLTNLYANEILNEADLPRYLCAYTPCFRREAGSYGRDMRGMIRQHQFDKVELVKLTSPETSYQELEHLTKCAEEVLKLLDIPYRVVCLSSGDIGFGASKTYDIEVWLPSQNNYREISSCSNCEDFQARRMNIKYRPIKGTKTRFVHTLNGSGVAIGRCLIAIVENYQNEDGSITVPKALRSYVDGLEKIS